MQVGTSPVVGKQEGFLSWVFGWGKSGSGSVQQEAKDTAINEQSEVAPVAHQPVEAELFQSVHKASDLARSLVASSLQVSEETPEPVAKVVASSSQSGTSQPIGSQTQQVVVEAHTLNELLSRLSQIEARLAPTQLQATQASVAAPVTSAATAVVSATASSVASKIGSLFSGIYANRYFLLSQLSVALLVLQFVHTSTQQEVATSEEFLNTNDKLEEEVTKTLMATFAAIVATLKELPLEVAVVLVLDVLALLSGTVANVGHKGVAAATSLFNRKKATSEPLPGVNVAPAKKTAEEKKND